jgi:hypothetical protein
LVERPAVCELAIGKQEIIGYSQESRRNFYRVGVRPGLREEKDIT